MTSVQIANGTIWNRHCRPENNLSLQLFHGPSTKSSVSLFMSM